MCSAWDRIDKFFKENKDIQPILEEVSAELIRDQCYSLPIHYVSTIERLLELYKDSVDSYGV